MGAENPESHWIEEQKDRLGVTTAVEKGGRQLKEERGLEGSHFISKLPIVASDPQTRHRVQLKLKGAKQRFTVTHHREMAFSGCAQPS